ncbi:hypothetical protein Tco_0383075 [Tanacetum coccineum]
MLLREILLDVVGTSRYHYGVLRSFPVERIEQGNTSNVFQSCSQETPGDLTTGDRLSPKVKVFLIPVIGYVMAAWLWLVLLLYTLCCQRKVSAAKYILNAANARFMLLLETPGDLTTGDRLSPKVKVFLIPVIELRRKLELAQKQKDEIQLTVENFENSSKSLSKLIECQIVDKYKTGLGYNAIPSPYTGNFMPPKPDLSFSGLEEFVNEPIVSEPIVKKPVVETSEAKASKEKPKAVRKNNGALIIEDWVSDSEEENVPQAKIEKKIVKPSFAKIKFVKSKEQVKSPRKIRLNTHSPRGNQRN